ncbi:MAG TPA: hypothetical protein VMV43_05265 [Candidatus Nanopelagicaceae bacterium]|nr:hypothetical protein [Candidatus Nanopelagicaceae bacterium]
MPYKIAFDVAHKPRGKIDENLTELRDFLNANDFMCYNFLETPITQNSLKPFDILVFVCPDFAKITSMEITEINSWVRNDGGGLLLLSHAGGDRGRNSNLSELSQIFGIVFENDQVLDETYNLGMENTPIITSFIPPHPITNSISSICYRSGCSLSVLGNSISIISSNETSEPFSSPLVCVSEPDKGRICAIGSYELFRDRVGGGFSNDEHPNLAYNIFSWLISDYRMELHTSGAVPEIVTRKQASEIDPLNYTSETPQSSLIEKRKVDIDFSMKISKKSELVELLKIFQNQIDMIKTTIDKLIKTTIASEKVIFEHSNPPENAKSIEKKVTDDSKSNVFDELLETNDVLTDLPPKPESLKFKDEGDFIGLPKIDDTNKLKPVPKATVTGKIKKRDLVTEKKALESKLNSVRTLLDFIEKKHDSGQMDEKSFEKRASQLKSDLITTQNKIDEIDKKLK